MHSSNPPQASPTIQEILIEQLDDYHDGGEFHDYTPLEKERHANHILTLFSRIITEARPEKKHYGDTCTPTHCFCMYTPRNDAIDQYERNLRAAIAKSK